MTVQSQSKQGEPRATDSVQVWCLLDWISFVWTWQWTARSVAGLAKQGEGRA